MKIAFISTIDHLLPPNGLGWETNAYYLIKNLQQKGIDVTVYATGDSQVKNLRFSSKYSFEKKDKLGISEYWKYEHISKAFYDNIKEKFDLIHGWYNYEQIIFSKFAPTTPILTTFHGIKPKYIDFYTKLYSRLESNNYIVGISKDNMNIFPDANWAGIAYHGLHIEDYPFVKNPQDYYCVVGRIDPEKGIAEIVKLATKLGLKLKIAGGITNQDYFNQFIKPYISDKIQYLGLLDYRDKIKLFANAKASFHFAMYPFREAFGNTLTESMACGTPVIALNNGSIPEIVMHNKTGFVVGSVDQAEKAVPKVEKIQRKDCRELVENKFTDAHMADSYIKIYKNVIEKHKNAR